MVRVVNIIGLVLIVISQTFSQTADVVEGCTPLEVSFSSVILTDYFWDFGDNSSSNLAEPMHTFTQAGTYEVQLRNGVGGSLVGTLTITVFPDPIVNIQSTMQSGCVPLEVEFSPDIILDPSIVITSYQWIFGDGNTSTEESPSHIYTSTGKFTVSLKLFAENVECDYLEIFKDYVFVLGTKAAFAYNQPDPCEVPSTVTFVNMTEQTQGNTYLWNLGNGQTSTNYNPSAINYTEPGTYNVSLQVTTASGCVSTQEKAIIVGVKDGIEIVYPDSTCINEVFLIINTSLCKEYQWTYPNGYNDNSVEDAIAPYGLSTVGGNSQFTFSCLTLQDCWVDTTFSIFFEAPIAEFTIDPEYGCHSVEYVDFQALTNPRYTYFWNQVEGPSFFTDTLICAQQDSFFTNREINRLYWLRVETDLGCKDSIVHFYFERKPNASILAEPNRGCAPLDVTFKDWSLSFEDLVYYKWDLGDGTILEGPDIVEFNHIYQEPGEYYTKLIVETINGCRDTSYGVFIEVGEPLPASFTIDKTTVCLGEEFSVEVLTDDPRVDSWHVSIDEGRYNHCSESPNATSSIINDIGVYPLTIVTEYNGCFNEIETDTTITVLGAKAKIEYLKLCETPFDIQLWEEVDADDQSKWYIDGILVSESAMFDYHFDERGDYEVVLFSEDGSGCPATTDTVDIYIREVSAVLNGPDTICPRKYNEFTAMLSKDANEFGCQPYRFAINDPDIRPYSVDSGSVNYKLNPGNYQVTLTVTDVNGCTDSDTHDVYVTSVTADFDLPYPGVCPGSDLVFENNSISDLELVGYDWSFGASDENPIHTFENNLNDTIFQVTLIVKNEYSCVDTIQKEYYVYNPQSNIEYDNGLGLCVGDSIQFFAEDFTEEASYFDFNWQFGDSTSSIEQSPVKYFNERGEYLVFLEYSENRSGCGGEDSVLVKVVDLPIAAFYTSVDSLDPICYPEIIDFIDESETDGEVLYNWTFGEDQIRFVTNPTYTFGKGTFDIQLHIESIYGCADTATTSFTLVGPEGTFTLVPNPICLEDSIQVALVDTVEVTSFTWDFGDGTVLDDVNPAVHVYAFLPPSGSTVVKAILRTQENGCEVILESPLEIVELLPDFTIGDTLLACGLQAQFYQNTSSAQVFEWDFGDGNGSNLADPNHLYPQSGLYTIFLTAIDTLSGCIGSISKDVEFISEEFGIAMPNVFTPNGDQTNDYFVPVSLSIGAEFEIVTFKIYNRWGNLVYDNLDPVNGWDGMYGSEQAPSEVYAYYIELRKLNCSLETFKGNVTLIR